MSLDLHLLIQRGKQIAGIAALAVYASSCWAVKFWILSSYYSLHVQETSIKNQQAHVQCMWMAMWYMFSGYSRNQGEIISDMVIKFSNVFQYIDTYS